MSGPIRVVLAEDEDYLRSTFARTLSLDPDIQIVGEAADGEQALRLVQELQPDVLLLDLKMPSLDGIEVLEQLAEMELGTQVLVMSSYKDETAFKCSLNAGARGYFYKLDDLQSLHRAVRTTARGDHYFSSTMGAHLLDKKKLAMDRLGQRGVKGQGSEAAVWAAMPEDTEIESWRKSLEQLSSRHWTVVQGLMAGKSPASIAEWMGLSLETVRHHIQKIRGSVGAKTTAELLRRVAFVWLRG